jgi:hypothetical protein
LGFVYPQFNALSISEGILKSEIQDSVHSRQLKAKNIINKSVMNCRAQGQLKQSLLAYTPLSIMDEYIFVIDS